MIMWVDKYEHICFCKNGHSCIVIIFLEVHPALITSKNFISWELLQQWGSLSACSCYLTYTADSSENTLQRKKQTNKQKKHVVVFKVQFHWQTETCLVRKPWEKRSQAMSRIHLTFICLHFTKRNTESYSILSFFCCISGSKILTTNVDLCL